MARIFVPYHSTYFAWNKLQPGDSMIITNAFPWKMDMERAEALRLVAMKETGYDFEVMTDYKEWYIQRIDTGWRTG